jgi:ribosomal protein L37E
VNGKAPAGSRPREELSPDTYRLRAQVCPRGCEFKETARRQLIADTRFLSFGRASLRAEHAYESSNCPICGALLMRRCTRCGKAILALVGERCASCGLPHPWAAERRSGLAQQTVRFLGLAIVA